jgi:hypothetical protein
MQEEAAMAADDPKDLIVRVWRAGRMSYVEALRRLLDFGVPLDAATKRLAAEGPAGTARSDGAPPRS